MSLHLKGAALLAILVASPAVADDQNAALGARLDPVIDHAIADKRIVGTVVLVARDGELVYARAAGLADREAGRAMKEDDIFRFASVTKPFVTAAAMRLVEQGVSRLTTPSASGSRTSSRPLTASRRRSSSATFSTIRQGSNMASSSRREAPMPRPAFPTGSTLRISRSTRT